MSQDYDLLGRRVLIDQELEKILRSLEQNAREIDPLYEELVRELRVLVMRGGKRLRPFISLLSFQGYGGSDIAAMAQVAAALELLHTFLLIHDDIIDRDLTRHHGPNIAGSYAEKLKKHSDALHYANSAALLAGDLGHLHASQLIMGSNFTPLAKVEAQSILNRCLFEVIGGELVDTFGPMGVGELTEQTLLNIARYKTASYSFVLPLQIGAVFAGAPAAELAKLNELGQQLGVAFQLQDDLLGMFGEEAQTGKPANSDLEEGKRTLLIEYGMSMSDAAQAQQLQLLLQKGSVAPEDLQLARTIIETSGARQKVSDLIDQQLEGSRSVLQATAMSAEAKTAATQLIESLLGRDR